VHRGPIWTEITLGVSSTPVKDGGRASDTAPASSAPPHFGPADRPRRATRKNPIAPARRMRSERATGSGPGYPSWRALSSTHLRSSGESWSGRLYAFDTVVRETPSSAASDARVARRRALPTGPGGDGNGSPTASGGGAGRRGLGRPCLLRCHDRVPQTR